MYWFDTTLLAFLAASAILGAWSGFVRQMARIVCISLSCCGAIVLHEPVVGFLREIVLKDASPMVLDVLAYASVFVVGYLVLHCVAYLIREAVREADLEVYDRLLGSLFGAGKMALLLGVVCLGMMNNRHPATETILEKSKLAGFFADGMERIVVMVPEEYKDRLKETIFHLRDQMG
jgi:uncharacterized membrane protein required for colicin V production